MKAIQTYNQLPKVAQYVVIGAGLFLGYKLYQKFFGKSGSEDLTDNLLDLNLTDIDKWKKAGQTANFTSSQYFAMANGIYEATKYGLGDNYGDVVKICKKLINNLDVAYLIKAYGTKQNYFFGIPSGEKRDLFTNIRTELGNEYGGLTAYKLDQINNDWKSKNITYQI